MSTLLHHSRNLDVGGLGTMQLSLCQAKHKTRRHLQNMSWELSSSCVFFTGRQVGRYRQVGRQVVQYYLLMLQLFTDVEVEDVSCPLFVCMPACLHVCLFLCLSMYVCMPACLPSLRCQLVLLFCVASSCCCQLYFNELSDSLPACMLCVCLLDL